MVVSWWQRWFPRQSRPAPHGRRAAPRRRGPGLLLETLEDRLTPATHTWTGAGTDALWSDALNWNGGAPAAGETNVVLNFGAANALQKANTDDVAGLVVQQLNFTDADYTLAGTQSLTVAGGIADTSTNSGSTILPVNSVQVATTLGGNVSVQVADPGRALTLGGSLSGSGGLTKTGAGSLTLGGFVPNFYTGTTQVSQGVLNLDKFQAVAGPLVVGDGVGGANADQVFLHVPSATAATVPVTVTPSGELVLGDGSSSPASDTIGALDMTGGEVLGTPASSSAPASLLTLGGDVTSHPAATPAHIDANLSLGGAPRTFNVADGAADPDLIVTGVISDTGASSSSSGGPNLTPMADLVVTKTAPVQDTAGDSLEYTITLSNAGPDDAQNVVLTDALPATTTFLDEFDQGFSGFSCSHPNPGSTGTVTCTSPTLAAGQSTTFFVDVLIASSAAATLDGDPIQNTASVSSSTADPNSVNNTASASTTVNAQADLWVQKSGPAQFSTGGNLTYTVSVTNIGPSDAQNVTLTDAVPAGTTFVSESQPTGPTFSCAAPAVGATGNVTCTISTLAAGSSATFQLVVQSSPSGLGGPITNTATVSSTTTDPNTDDNTATVTTGSQADLSVTKTGPKSATAGTEITYTITVSNSAVTGTGPDAAQNVTLTDVLPATLRLEFVQQTQGSPQFVCFEPGNTVTCSANDLASGASVTFEVFAQVPSDVPDGTVITNSALVSSDNDPNPANNSSAATTAVTTAADVSVSVTPPAAPASAGGNLTYTIAASNAGPSDAQNVTLTDAVPTNTTYVSLSADGVGCSAPEPGGTGPVTCNFPTLAGDSAVPLVLVVKVNPGTPPGTTITDVATIGSTSTTDPNPGNNTASAVNTTVAAADLAVTKTGPSSAPAGGNLTYTISLTNNGPDAAQSVSLTDVVSSGATYVSETQTAGSDAFSCSPPGQGSTGQTFGSLVCSAAAVPAGHADVFRVVFRAGTSAPSVFNSVEVFSQTVDPDLSNNFSSVVTNVPLTANSVTKVGAGTLLLTGNNVYVGTTTVSGGTLLVDGTQPGSPVLVNGGTLGGHGTVGPTTVAAGTVSPEETSGGTPARLTVAGNFTLGAGGAFLAHLDNATAGTGYSQLRVTGTVSLAGSLVLSPGVPAGSASAFTIIDNAGPQPVQGNFRGLADSALLPGTGVCVHLTYHGDDGNNVVVQGVGDDYLFVRGVYRGLNLPIDDAAINAYVRQLTSGQQTRRQVAIAIWNSPAHRLVELNAFYTTFGEPVNDGKFARFLRELRSGTPEGQVLIEFLTSKPFVARHRSRRATAQALIGALTGNQHPTRKLVVGTARQLTGGPASRAQYLTQFLSSPGVYLAALKDQFAAFPHRNPTQADMTFFLGKLASGERSPLDLMLDIVTGSPSSSPSTPANYAQEFLTYLRNHCATL